jgi:hypothetical protein
MREVALLRDGPMPEFRRISQLLAASLAACGSSAARATAITGRQNLGLYDDSVVLSMGSLPRYAKAGSAFLAFVVPSRSVWVPSQPDATWISAKDG